MLLVYYMVGGTKPADNRLDTFPLKIGKSSAPGKVRGGDQTYVNV